MYTPIGEKTLRFDHRVTLALVGLAVAAGYCVYIPGMDRPYVVYTVYTHVDEPPQSTHHLHANHPQN